MPVPKHVVKGKQVRGWGRGSTPASLHSREEAGLTERELGLLLGLRPCAPPSPPPPSPSLPPPPPPEVVAFAILACELFSLGLPVFLGRGSPVLSLRSHNLEKSLHVWSLSSLTMTRAFSGLFWWQLVSWFSRADSSITLTVSAFNLPKKTSVSCDLTVWAVVLCHSDCLVCLLPCSPVLHTEWGSRASLCTLEVNKYLKFILGQGKRGECEFVWVFLTLKLSKTLRWQHRKKGQAFLTVS